MNDRPTPETDAQTYVPLFGESIVPSKLASRLERERDEAREALREIAEASGFDNIGNWARNKARKALELGKEQGPQGIEGREMKDQEINIAIAEACGWEWRVGIYGNCRGLFHQDDEYSKSYKCTAEQMNDLPISSDCAGRVPDYCNDLNAMHDAENSLVENLDLYEEWLASVCGESERLFLATALRRAESLLRMIGKWKETWK